MQELEPIDDYSMDSITGQQLSAVTFGLNYRELSFNSDVIYIIHDLQVFVASSVYQLGDPGYRDRLCERITHVVVKAEARPGDAVEIVFDDDSTIVMSVGGEENMYGPGRVFYQPFRAYKDWWVL
jgi:hypothetical protein